MDFTLSNLESTQTPLPLRRFLQGFARRKEASAVHTLIFKVMCAFL